MNVCLLNDSFPPLLDGVSNTVLNYARVLGERGEKAAVATPSYPGVTDDYPFEVVRYASLDTTKSLGYRTGFPFSAAAMQRLEAFSPTLIHSHCPMASTFLARELRCLTGAPIVFTYHTKFDVDIRRVIKGKLLQESAIREIIRNIEACDEVWAVNRGAGENLKSLGFRGDYLVMENGVDMTLDPVPEEELRRLEETYRIKACAPVFLFVGRMLWYKGLSTILDSLAELKRAGEPFTMLFVGDGEDLAAVRERAERQGLSGDCVFPGAIRDRALLKALYTRADLFLLPSVFDNNPLVVKEAAACRTASALIRGSSSAENVTDGENGFLTEDSVPSFTRALLAVCRRPELAKEAGERASRTLYLSWEDAIDRAVARYREILRDRRGGDRTEATVSDKMIEAIGRFYRLTNRPKTDDLP